MPDPDDTPRSVHGGFWRFAALTALNPLTAVYFVALAAGLGGSIAGPASAIPFVIGVFVGSVAWQLVLGLGGAALGPRLGPGLRRATSVGGYGIVVLLALALAWRAVGA